MIFQIVWIRDFISVLELIDLLKELISIVANKYRMMQYDRYNVLRKRKKLLYEKFRSGQLSDKNQVLFSLSSAVNKYQK